MSNPLESLKLDYWYKALLAMCSVLLIVSLTVPLQGINNNVAQLLSLGGIFIGLGEWINHPLQERIGPGFKVSGHPWRFTLLGTGFDLVGLACIWYGVYKLTHAG